MIEGLRVLINLTEATPTNLLLPPKCITARIFLSKVRLILFPVYSLLWQYYIEFLPFRCMLTVDIISS